MFSKKKKLKTLKKYISILEPKIIALKFIINNKSCSSKIRWSASLLLSSYKKYCRTKLKQRCQLTNRSRSFLRFFQLSRITARNFACEGKLPFISKVSW